MCFKSFSAEQVHQGPLVLINATHGSKALQERCDMLALTPKVMLEKNAAKMLLALLNALKAEDEILCVSGLRTQETQALLYRETLETFGEAYTQAFVAKPGHSEHQTGLAIDLGKKTTVVDLICPEFPYEGICQSFRTLAPTYGFIERYPKGKEQVTGIAHEPWHFRYVGVPHAEIITTKGLTLEEYHLYIKTFVYGERFLEFVTGGYAFKLAYMPLERAQDGYEIDDAHYVTILGNNVDGFVYTEMVSL